LNVTESVPHPRLRRSAAKVLILAALWTGVQAADTPAPNQVIETTATTIATTVAARHDELTSDRRKLIKVIDDLIRPRFDLDTTCRLILGQHWKAATPEQRRRFTEAFYWFLVASYGHSLRYFSHRTLEVLPDQDPIAGPSSSVHTKMTLTNGDTYDVDFYMRLDDHGWRIVDVLVEGVSYVRSYRSDFGLEVHDTSLDALSTRLENIKPKK